VTFDPAELETIKRFRVGPREQPEWRDSPLRPVVVAAPTSKGRFARTLIERLGQEAGVSVARVPGRRGSRFKVGSAVCELKFSTEDPPRFQQVRPPADGYDYLVGIAARPDRLVYWFMAAEDVTQLMEDGSIAFQHAETSRWFFPRVTGRDEFSSFRHNAKGLVNKLRSLK
jgi:hypothetical protein